MSNSFCGLNSGHLLKNSLSDKTKCCTITRRNAENSTFVTKFILIKFLGSASYDIHSKKLESRLSLRHETAVEKEGLRKCG